MLLKANLDMPDHRRQSTRPRNRMSWTRTDISTNEQPQTVQDPDLDETIMLPGLDDTIMLEESGQGDDGSTNKPGVEDGYDSNDSIELIITGDPIIPTPSPGPRPRVNVSNLQSTDSAPSDTPTEQPEATPTVIPIVPDSGVPTVAEETPATPIVTPTGPPISPTGPHSPTSVHTPSTTPARRGKRPGRAGEAFDSPKGFCQDCHNDCHVRTQIILAGWCG